MAIPKDIPSLPFVWHDFEYGRPGDCFSACVIMCCRYWARRDPTLDLPLSRNALQERLGESYFSRSGLSVERIRQVLKKQEINDLDGERITFGLDMEIRTPTSIESLYPFLMIHPPIPIIISFDKQYTEKNVSSDKHAVILYSLDYEKELISIIDPVKRHLREPYSYEFRRFELGWALSDNLIFITTPLGKLDLITGKEVKVIKQAQLTEY